MDILELVHGDNQPMNRRFLCQEQDCGKAFSRNSDLVRHLRIHSNDRPYACDWPGCGKAFIQRSALTVHRRVHTGERPHKCTHPACSKAFGDSSSLARHRRVHTGARPYLCTFPRCQKTFCRKITLTKHIKRHHAYPSPAPSSSGGFTTARSRHRRANKSPISEDEDDEDEDEAEDYDEEDVPMRETPEVSPAPIGLGINFSGQPKQQVSVPMETALSVPLHDYIQRCSSAQSNRSAPPLLESSTASYYHNRSMPPAFFTPGCNPYMSPPYSSHTPAMTDSSVFSTPSTQSSAFSPASDTRYSAFVPPLRLQSSNMDAFDTFAPRRPFTTAHDPLLAPRPADIDRFGRRESFSSSPLADFELQAPSPTWPNYFSLNLSSPLSPRHPYNLRSASFSKDFSSAHSSVEDRRSSFCPGPFIPQHIQEQYDLIERSL